MPSVGPGRTAAAARASSAAASPAAASSPFGGEVRHLFGNERFAGGPGPSRGHLHGGVRATRGASAQPGLHEQRSIEASGG